MITKIVAVLGAALILVGTVISLVPALTIDIDKVGTCGWYDNLENEYKIQKKQAKKGIALIIFGTILQMVAVVLG